MTTADRMSEGDEAMAIEPLAPGIWKASAGRVGLFYGVCAAGCRWLLEPDYRTGGWRAQHGDNPEAALLFERGELREQFDAAEMMARLGAWLSRCHAYEESDR